MPDLFATSPSWSPTNVCFRRILLVAVRSGEGPLTEHITATQAQPPERVFMPLSRPSRRPDDQWGKAFFPDGAVNLRFLAA